MSAIVVPIAVELTHIVFASLRTAAEWIRRYLEHIHAFRRSCASDMRPSACITDLESRRSLLPAARPSHWPIFDMMPVGGVWLAAGIALLLGGRGVIRWIRKKRDEDGDLARRTKLARTVRNLIVGMPWNARFSPWILVPLLVGFAGIILAVGTAHENGHATGEWPVLLAIHATALIVPVIVFATILFAPVRTVVSMAGDVIGYWPPRFVALSGNSYTEVVCPRIAKEAGLVPAAPEATVVVVGHSQGSVLAFTTLARSAADANGLLPRRVSLVTCGSPLHTLYFGFFPQYFSDQAVADLREALGGRWIDLWRDTDPIAAPILVGLPGGTDRADRRIEAERDFEGKLTRHSNYWTESQQAAAVTELMRGEFLNVILGEPSADPSLSSARAIHMATRPALDHRARRPDLDHRAHDPT